ncbi:cytochrome d ubiquinol oxidase subunit II [Methylomonas lenta]|uniref:Cytochrome d ubiquinol oxidase subunit II n=1 Tax=Methylomonas lenta TaxID=980561 RepID=A0A177N0M5_9GAMM|nr:cytochrome d ubiquinol oxidase subunit II [Methylomonas lenta]OAI11204.1 cytochrome d ubiquinol oxidase subunit II [Methylomonas lenta]
MTIDLESLRLIWWALLGLVMVSFVLCEGLTLGVCLLLPMIGKSESQRLTLISNIVPTSMGNLAWFIAMLTIVFAAWPIAYAVTMASVYPLLLLVLLAILLRPLAMYFQHASNQPLWQQYSAKVLVVGGVVPATLLGLLAGNMLKGIPFHLDSDMRILFLGDFAGLFNLFSILAAACSVALLALHGAVFIQLKTNGELQQNAKALTLQAGVAFLLLFATAGLWIMHLEGYHIDSDILPDAASNPLAKFVKRGEGLWLDNYEHLPLLWALPVLAFMGGLAAILFAKWDKTYFAMIASSLCVSMVVLTFGVSMFPFLLPSNISLNSSMTIWDSSASHMTLQSLLWLAVFALPMMVISTRWVFCLFAKDNHRREMVWGDD